MQTQCAPIRTLGCPVVANTKLPGSNPIFEILPRKLVVEEGWWGKGIKINCDTGVVYGCRNALVFFCFLRLRFQSIV